MVGLKKFLKLILRNLGTLAVGALLLSAGFATAAQMGYHPGICNFLAIWFVILSLAIMMFRLSFALQSPVWALLSSFAMLFITVLLVSRIAGHLTGTILCPTMYYGTGLCANALLWSGIGAAIFYFTDWKKGKLGPEQKNSLLTAIFAVPVVAAIYLSGAPLAVAYVVLYAAIFSVIILMRKTLFKKS